MSKSAPKPKPMMTEFPLENTSESLLFSSIDSFKLNKSTKYAVEAPLSYRMAGPNISNLVSAGLHSESMPMKGSLNSASSF